MDVKRVLAQAWEAVEGSGVPEALHGVAFAEAVRLIAGAASSEGRAGAPSPQSRRSSPQGAQQGMGLARDGTKDRSQLVADEDEFFAKFSEESGVDEAVLRGVYYIKDGGVRLSLSRRVLGESIAEKNRTVAMLTLGAMYFVRGDMALKIGEVRQAIALLNYDASRNLSSHLDTIPGTQAVGAKGDKAVRVQSGRFEAAFKELIQRIAAS